MTAVAIELAALVVLAATGWLLTPSGHGSTWRMAVALPVGVAAHSCAALVLLATRLPVARPWVALVVALGVAAVAGVRRGDALPSGMLIPPRRALVAAGSVAVGTVAVTAMVPLVNVTSDSFRYLTVARLLATDGDASGMSAFLLQSRSLVVGAVHGLAAADPGYLRALSPLVALSLVVVLWLLVRAATTALDPSVARWVAGGAAVLLATNHRFLFNALYVNGHLLFAVWVLLLVAIGWRRVAGATPRGDGLLAVLLAVGLTVLRPEGVLVAGVVVLPVVLAPLVDRAWRRWVLVGLGAGTVLWHLGVLAPLVLREDKDLSFSVTGLGLLGVGLAVVAAVLPVLDRLVGGWTLPALHLGTWAVVGLLTIRDPAIFVETAKATFRNVLDEGGWGASLLVLAGMLVIAVVLRRVEHEQVWLFPLLTFVPLAVLLAFLREGAYRVGPGDSLNRMLLHIVPLTVFALAVTADGEPRRSRRDRGRAVTADGRQTSR